MTIGNSVRSIGDYAFSYCRSLTSVTIPNGVTSIGEYAFCNCSGLASITIPTSVTSIGAWAFAECNWVITLYISDLMAWCKSLPGGVVMNPHGGVNLYLNGNKVTTLTIPGSVTSIKSYAFYCFNGLTSVTIPDSVTSIGSAAFSHCKDLTSVKIGNGVKSIGDEAFCYSSGLTSVTIPSSVTSIGNGTFGGNQLVVLKVATDNPSYKAVSGLLLTKDGKTLVAVPGGLASVTIPDSVTSIGERAFYNSSGLTSVTIPDSVTSIEEKAFYGCSSLTRVTVPDSVTGIGEWAFYYCSGLTNVTIGNSATRIGAYAFCECRRLASVIFKGNALRVGNSAFSYVGSGCTAYVKESSTGWGVEIPGMWNRLNIQYMTPEMEWLVDRGLTADARAANGRTAAECYVLGLDPADATNDFRIVSIELVDGKPKVEWEPKMNRWTGAEIQAVLKGAETLGGPWEDVLADGGSPGTARPTMRFFKVVVEMP